MYRGGLDRFKKAQALEPFSVQQSGPGAKTVPTAVKVQPAPLVPPQNSHLGPSQSQHASQSAGSSVAGQEAAGAPRPAGTQFGGGQSTWQPPDWAIEPRPGVYYLEVMKDGNAIDRINLDKKRHIFGRQVPACEIVLDHQSVSRQHAAVVPHKNGSIYVIDLGSVHGTFVANERLTKDSPVELEVGQSLRFAASTRAYVLRKNTAAFFPTQSLPSDSEVPLKRKSSSGDASASAVNDDNQAVGRPSKRSKKRRVSFRDQVGGELIQVVGISDGADVETEPGPVGVKEGSLVGKYESLVQVTVIPKGKEQTSSKDSASHSGVTDKLQQMLNKVKSTSRGGMYDDLYGDSVPAKLGSSWAYKSDGQPEQVKVVDEKKSSRDVGANPADDSDDDLFGD
ncbi:unnamed protein product [Triticum turgidum subsp. durum]|uniref:FHA domain-containing protein n=1 Tax=Triticum turgidum subsp. durum TaxID=4567 RepID=A0A9R0PXX8_TRITD|nr:unnamed protein product [Triticum turgidum subsp. durum]